MLGSFIKYQMWNFPAAIHSLLISSSPPMLALRLLLELPPVALATSILFSHFSSDISADVVVLESSVTPLSSESAPYSWLMMRSWLCLTWIEVLQMIKLRNSQPKALRTLSFSISKIPIKMLERTLATTRTSIFAFNCPDLIECSSQLHGRLSCFHQLPWSSWSQTKWSSPPFFPVSLI